MRTRTILVGTLAALALTACSGSGDSDSNDSTPAPAYEVTKQDDSGKSRNVEASVTTTKDLEGVFDAITKDLKDDAGYFIYINCKTGGTGTSDNRLANGRLARGNLGKAVTGLDDGATEYEAVKDHTCP